MSWCLYHFLFPPVGEDGVMQASFTLTRTGGMCLRCLLAPEGVRSLLPDFQAIAASQIQRRSQLLSFGHARTQSLRAEQAGSGCGHTVQRSRPQLAVSGATSLWFERYQSFCVS